MIRKLINLLPKWLLKREYKKQKFNRFNERPVEYSYLFRKLNELNPKTILDVGSGLSALPSLLRTCGYLVAASDKRTNNRHYHIIKDDITDTKIKGKFDLITCISVIEHILEHKKAIINMLSLLNPGGHIIITFPYNENNYVENVYKLPNSFYGDLHIKYITQSFSRKELDSWGVKIIHQEYWYHWTGIVWSHGEPIIPLIKLTKEKPHQLTLIIIRRR